MSTQSLLGVPGLLLFTAALVLGQQTCSDKSEGVTLTKSLFCGYDMTVRPVKKHTTTTHVKIRIWLKHFDLEEHSNILRLNTWTSMTWTDELLTWDPNSYNSMSETRVESDSIWVPDIVMHTSVEYSGPHHRMPSTSCMLRNTGEMMCVPPTSYAALCSPDITKWPFDIQECTAEMTSWTHTGKDVSLELEGNGVSMQAYTQTRGWDLLTAEARHMSFNFSEDNDTYQYIDFYFKLKRHSGSHAATVVVPALVLAVTTLLMFFMDPISPQRLHLGCMNVLAHCIYLQYLGMTLPSNGASTPIIVIFFRDSLLLVGMSLIVTIILRGVVSAERPPPAWISSGITWILESRPGQILILSQLNPQGAAVASADDGAGLVDNATDKPKNNVWSFTAIFLDRVFLIVFTITLFILLVGFVP